jgi:IS30 family transposase
MVQYKKFTMVKKKQVCFCEQDSPWQRGTNETTKGLVRGFFSKGTDFNLVTKENYIGFRMRSMRGHVRL